MIAEGSPEDDTTRQEQIISARGHSEAALVLTMAGLGWVVIGLSALGGVPLGMLLAALGVFAVLLLSTLALQRGVRVLPPSSQSPDVERVLRRATAFEIAVIAAVLLGAGLLHKPAYIMPLVSLAVGLHFFPLAGALRRPLYYMTGSALCALAVLVPLLVPPQLRGHHIPGWLLAVGLGGGVTLWATTLALLVRGWALLRELTQWAT